jgi:hypothetical protein
MISHASPFHHHRQHANPRVLLSPSPGEYVQTSKPESTPFCLQDIHLHSGHQRITHLTCPLEDLHTASFVTTNSTFICLLCWHLVWHHYQYPHHQTLKLSNRHAVGILASDISVHSLQPSGTLALL